VPKRKGTSANGHPATGPPAAPKDKERDISKPTDACGLRLFFSLLTDFIVDGKDNQMAKKPNYGFEKRQKEIARKAKQDEKNKRKLEEKTDESASVDE
jgi:hypothetical protein